MADHNNSFSDLETWLNQRRVTEIECLVPDLTGVARGKILPREKFTEDRGMRLPEAIVAMGVTGEFPSEGPYYDVITPTDRDMHLRPAPTARAHRARGHRPHRAGAARLLRLQRQPDLVRAALGAAQRDRAVHGQGLEP